MKEVVLLVGPPGSGKSAIARGIVDSPAIQCFSTAIIDVNNLFVGEHRQWQFDYTKLAEGYAHSRRDFVKVMDAVRIEIIVVDQCNLIHKERKFYIDEALARGYAVHIWITPTWGTPRGARECFLRAEASTQITERAWRDMLDSYERPRRLEYTPEST